MALGVLDRPFSGHAPLPRRRDDPELGGKGSNAHIEPDLVIALAGAAVSHCRCSFLASGIHQELGYQRAGEGGGQRVLPFVYRVGLEGGEDVIVDESIPGIHHLRFDCSHLKRLLPN